MELEQKDNATPTVYTTKKQIRDIDDESLLELETIDPIDAEEIFDYIRDINDPEHPYTLEELNVVQENLIKVVDNDDEKYVEISFTPTIPHCSMATLIGLSIYVKLKRSLHPSFKVLVYITPGSHNTEEAINRQLADKERLAAAMENQNLVDTINNCLRLKEIK